MLIKPGFLPGFNFFDKLTAENLKPDKLNADDAGEFLLFNGIEFVHCRAQFIGC